MNLNTVTFGGNLVDTSQPVANVPGPLLTTAAAAALLGLTADNLANLRHVDAGPDWVQLGRTVRYVPDDLDWWLEQLPADVRP
jgi:hypothetical protein